MNLITAFCTVYFVYGWPERLTDMREQSWSWPVSPQGGLLKWTMHRSDYRATTFTCATVWCHYFVCARMWDKAKESWTSLCNILKEGWHRSTRIINHFIRTLSEAQFHVKLHPEARQKWEVQKPWLAFFSLVRWSLGTSLLREKYQRIPSRVLQCLVSFSVESARGTCAFSTILISKSPRGMTPKSPWLKFKTTFWEKGHRSYSSSSLILQLCFLTPDNFSWNFTSSN